MIIRPTEPRDRAALLSLAAATGLFEPSQIGELDELLNRYFSRTPRPHIANSEFWLTVDVNGPIGVAYVAPERMTDSAWNLYLIAIHPDYQHQGYGTQLLHQVEHRLRQQGERLLLVETSGTEDFEPVRAFYQRNGYAEAAKVRDFYAARVDKVIFSKALETPSDGVRGIVA